MSFVHRLIVGHFDLSTFVFGQPVPLRSLDAQRTRAMLEEIGKSAGEGEYVVDGESLYFRGGYCDCPWLSAKRNNESERFARALAEIEDCYLIGTGQGAIRHPVRSVQAVPSDPLLRDEPRLAPLSGAEAEAYVRADDPAVLCRAVVDVLDVEGDWVAEFCVRMAGHRHFHVRGNALFALGRLAKRKAPLDRAFVQPLIESLMTDPVPYVAGHAAIAAKAVEHGLRWVIDSFDNGKPERDVSTYSNGWVKCPNCSLRFATYDPGAFREGRCMRCRQKLRVIDQEQ